MKKHNNKHIDYGIYKISVVFFPLSFGVCGHRVSTLLFPWLRREMLTSYKSPEAHENYKSKIKSLLMTGDSPYIWLDALQGAPWTVLWSVTASAVDAHSHGSCSLLFPHHCLDSSHIFLSLSVILELHILSSSLSHSLDRLPFIDK